MGTVTYPSKDLDLYLSLTAAECLEWLEKPNPPSLVE